MDQQSSPSLFSIGHVARVVGVAVQTLRSWEQAGLLSPQKQASGHRMFSDADIERARMIERMRTRGWSLSAIRQHFEDHEVSEADTGEEEVADGNWTDFNKLGARVRSLRIEHGYSLRMVAEKTEIAASHLSMFERGTAHLSPARLSAIADLFGCTLTELIGGTSADDVPVVRAGQGRKVGLFGPGVTIEQLTVAQHLMDAEVWTIDPGRESDGFYAHEGEELIFVLSGTLEVTLVGRNTETLGPGDCAYFNSRIAHHWRNTGEAQTQVLWINTDSDRLAGMGFEKNSRRIALGAQIGRGVGEGSATIELPDGATTFRVVETHTAGHPTRILMEPLNRLDAETVAGKRDQFIAAYDGLRPLLLHEPRGHSGSFGLVPVSSEAADFGAFFISSHGYPDLCGHAVIGFAKLLRSLGRLKQRSSFTVEVPAGVISVHLDAAGPDMIAIDFDDVLLAENDGFVELDGRTVPFRRVVAGEATAMVDAGAIGEVMALERFDALQALGARLRRAINDSLPRRRGKQPEITSVLLHGIAPDGETPLHLLVIDERKFDRSPGTMAVAARMAALAEEGSVEIAGRKRFLSLFGGAMHGEILRVNNARDGSRRFSVRVAAKAHLDGISTLIHEANDDLGTGFLR